MLAAMMRRIERRGVTLARRAGVRMVHDPPSRHTATAIERWHTDTRF
jgi:hypothetical protein